MGDKAMSTSTNFHSPIFFFLFLTPVIAAPRTRRGASDQDVFAASVTSQRWADWHASSSWELKHPPSCGTTAALPSTSHLSFSSDPQDGNIPHLHFAGGGIRLQPGGASVRFAPGAGFKLAPRGFADAAFCNHRTTTPVSQPTRATTAPKIMWTKTKRTSTMSTTTPAPSSTGIDATSNHITPVHDEATSSLHLPEMNFTVLRGPSPGVEGLASRETAGTATTPTAISTADTNGAANQGISGNIVVICVMVVLLAIIAALIFVYSKRSADQQPALNQTAVEMGQQLEPVELRTHGISTTQRPTSFINLSAPHIPASSPAGWHPQDVEWRKKAPLGKGSFGAVFEVRLLIRDTTARYVARKSCAAKVLPERFADAAAIAAFQTEVDLLCHLETLKRDGDPGANALVRYIGHISKDYAAEDDPNRNSLRVWSEGKQPMAYLKYPCLLMELCNGGNLEDFLTNARKSLTQQRPKEDAYCSVMEPIVYQIALGLAFLHKHHVIQRDLATRNILLHNNGATNSWKIADFGLARCLDASKNRKKGVYERGVHVLRGSVTKAPVALLPWAWTDPLAIARGEFRTASDMFSFGVLLFEIGTLGQCPKETYKQHNINYATYKADSPRFLQASDHVDNQWAIGRDTKLSTQAVRCWDANWKTRPTAAAMATEFQPTLGEPKSFPKYDNKRDSEQDENTMYERVLQCMEKEMNSVIQPGPADLAAAKENLQKAEGGLQKIKDKHQLAIDSLDHAYKDLLEDVDEATDALSELGKLGEPLADFVTFASFVSGGKKMDYPTQPLFKLRNAETDNPAARYLAQLLTFLAQPSIRKRAFSHLRAIVADLNVIWEEKGYLFELIEPEVKEVDRAAAKALRRPIRERAGSKHGQQAGVAIYNYSVGVAFNRILDILRAKILVIKGGLPAVAVAAKAVADSSPRYYSVVRHKNTLAGDFDAKEKSFGYRDYKMYLQPANCTWKFELQFIPAELDSVGDHDAFKSLRSAKEKLARAKYEMSKMSNDEKLGYASPRPAAAAAAAPAEGNGAGPDNDGIYIEVGGSSSAVMTTEF